MKYADRVCKLSPVRFPRCNFTDLGLREFFADGDDDARSMTGATKDLTAIRWLLCGFVQGHGIRPHVARIAQALELQGTVRNTRLGVEMVTIGTTERLRHFELAVASTVSAQLLRQEGDVDVGGLESGFQILPSESGERISTQVPWDVATCPECLIDFEGEHNRRSGYPLLSCVTCGPRYSIISQMPFDRCHTTMNPFGICEQCQADYENMDNRRFYAQTIACSACGPNCWASDGKGNRFGEGVAAIDEVAHQISEGKIAAVLGLGGYQLICDATNDAAVTELRRRKNRPSKPLPVMMLSLDWVKQVATLSATEASTLSSPSNPIVLVRVAEQHTISPHVCCGLTTIGVMLPTTPIHLQLLKTLNRSMVVTSGNLHGTPICFKVEDAVDELACVADVFLHHNRKIFRPVDDSVVQCVGNRTMTIRAGRGLAPMSFAIDAPAGIIAVGGHQKVATALTTGSQLVLSPHIGDMNSEPSRMRFEDVVQAMGTLYGVTTNMVACDSHPDYFTAQWSQRLTQEKLPSSQNGTQIKPVRRCEIQHHHAHVAASMLEHGLVGQSVLGVAFDGSGMADDGTVWGGEFLLTKAADYQRIGHLRRFRLPGGELAVTQPWRIALSVLRELGDDVIFDQWFDRQSIQWPKSACIATVLRGPLTSSMGRLFDAVASIVFGIGEVCFEGEAAMRLESACDRQEAGSYRFALQGNEVQTERLQSEEPWQLDWEPVLREIHDDLNKISPGRIAMRFHRAVSNAILMVAMRYGSLPCLLTGGVFQNRLLLELVSDSAEAQGVDLRLPGRIPINDGGLAVGQVVVANSRQHGERRCV